MIAFSSNNEKKINHILSILFQLFLNLVMLKSISKQYLEPNGQLNTLQALHLSIGFM